MLSYHYQSIIYLSHFEGWMWNQLSTYHIFLRGEINHVLITFWGVNEINQSSTYHILRGECEINQLSTYHILRGECEINQSSTYHILRGECVINQSSTYHILRGECEINHLHITFWRVNVKSINHLHITFWQVNVKGFYLLPDYIALGTFSLDLCMHHYKKNSGFCNSLPFK